MIQALTERYFQIDFNKLKNKINDKNHKNHIIKELSITLKSVVLTLVFQNKTDICTNNLNSRHGQFLVFHFFISDLKFLGYWHFSTYLVKRSKF